MAVMPEIDRHVPATVHTSDVNGTKRHFKLYLVILILFMTLGSFTFGYASAVIGTTLGQPSFFVHMGLDTAENAEQLIAAIVCLFFAGGIFGAFAQGWVSGRWGRKASIATGCAVIIISAALLAASINPAMFIVMRALNGFGGTMILSAVPLWIAEVAPPRHRAMLTDIHTTQLAVGSVLANSLGIAFYVVSNPDSWRAPIAIQMVPAAILLSGIYWVPESPRFLLTKGRNQEAWDIIYRFHSDPHDDTHAFAIREFYQMQKQVEFDNTMKTSYAEIFRRPAYRKRALLTMYLTFSLISGGVFVVNNYGSILYKELGFNGLQSLGFQTGWTATAFFSNALAMTIVDRFRRDYLLAVGFFTTGACMLAEALLQRQYLNSTNSSGLGAAVAFLFLYTFFYGLLLDGAAFFYVAEIWPSHLRAKGFAIGIGTLWLTALIFAAAAPMAFATIGWCYYLFFVVFSFLACLVVLLIYPNTLHKPLEEIAALFGDTDEVMVFQVDLQSGGQLETIANELQGQKIDAVAIHKERVV